MYNDISNEDFEFVERTDQDNWVIQLKTGEWKDTYYVYDSVKIDTLSEDLDDPDAEATLSFNYGLIDSPHDLNFLTTSVEFNQYIGDVLSYILVDSLESGKFHMGEKKEDNG